MANRHIALLRNQLNEICANKAEAIALLKNYLGNPMRTAIDGEGALARYGAFIIAFEEGAMVEKPFLVEDYNGGKYVILPCTPEPYDNRSAWAQGSVVYLENKVYSASEAIPAEGARPGEDETWKRYTLEEGQSLAVLRSVLGIVRVERDGQTKSISIFEDTDEIKSYIEGLVDHLDYTDTTTNNWITTAVSQTNGQIGVEKTELKTDGSIEYTYTTDGTDGHHIRESKVVISETERILGKIGSTTNNATLTGGTTTTNDVNFLSVNSTPLTTETVDPGTTYVVSTNYYRWNGNGYVAYNTNDFGKLITGISMVKMSDASVSQLDDPNVKDAYMLVDKNGDRIGDYIKIYKDSSLYKVYAGTEADTLQNMYLFTRINGSGVTPVYTKTSDLNPAVSTNNVPVYTTVSDDEYSGATTGSFNADTNILTVNGSEYLFSGYATPWITKVVIEDALVNPNSEAYTASWLIDENEHVIDPTTTANKGKVYHIVSADPEHGNKYYVWDSETSKYVELRNDPRTKKAMCFVYELAGLDEHQNGQYTLVTLSLEDYLTDYIFGRGLVYNPTTKILEVNPGYGVDFDASGRVTLSTNVLGGITYFAKSTNVSTDYALTATITNTNSEYRLLDGATVIVNFANDCTATSNLTLDVCNNTNSTGAKPIIYKKEYFDSSMIEAGDTLEFVYDAGSITPTGGSQITGFYRYVGKYGGGGTNGLEYITNTNNQTQTDYYTKGEGIVITNSYQNATLTTNATYSATWISGVTQTAGTPSSTKYRVMDSGNFYGRTYVWNGTRYVITEGVTQDITVKVAKTMVDTTGTNHIANLDNLISITTNGITLKNVWDCETY